MPREVAGHAVVQLTSTGNAGDEFLENEAASVTAAELF